MWQITILFVFHVIKPSLASITPEEIAVFEKNDFTITENGESFVFAHSGIPDHGFTGGWGNNPNTPTAQDYSYEIPKNPTALADGDEGCVRLGPVAMAISGAALYNPYTAFGYNAVAGDCKETFDHCNGHPDAMGRYHYHQLPACLYYNNTDLRDVLLGVAFDGYPIFGPMDNTGKNWTATELDKCNGHTYNGRYVYRITLDFPYIMGCYRGTLLFDTTPPANGGNGVRPPPPRQKREVKKIGHRYMYKRQMVAPQCNSEEISDWKAVTCWALCMNPSTEEYVNCVQDDGNTVTGPTGGGPTTENGNTDGGRGLEMSGLLLISAVIITSFYWQS